MPKTAMSANKGAGGKATRSNIGMLKRGRGKGAEHVLGSAIIFFSHSIPWLRCTQDVHCGGRPDLMSVSWCGGCPRPLRPVIAVLRRTGDCLKIYNC